MPQQRGVFFFMIVDAAAIESFSTQGNSFQDLEANYFKLNLTWFIFDGNKYKVSKQGFKKPFQ